MIFYVNGTRRDNADKSARRSFEVVHIMANISTFSFCDCDHLTYYTDLVIPLLPESEMFLFDPYKKYIQSNNETILDQGTPIKTSLVANIRAAYYIINNYFFISQAKNT